MDSGLALRAPRNDEKKKPAVIGDGRPFGEAGLAAVTQRNAYWTRWSMIRKSAKRLSEKTML